MRTVFHMQEKKMTPRSVILETQSWMTLTFYSVEMPVDYSVNWRMKETDRRREEKTKIELFWGETDIWIPNDIPNVFLAEFTDKFVLPYREKPQYANWLTLQSLFII